MTNLYIQKRKKKWDITFLFLNTRQLRSMWYLKTVLQSLSGHQTEAQISRKTLLTLHAPAISFFIFYIYILIIFFFFYFLFLFFFDKKLQTIKSWLIFIFFLFVCFSIFLFLFFIIFQIKKKKRKEFCRLLCIFPSELTKKNFALGPNFH